MIGAGKRGQERFVGGPVDVDGGASAGPLGHAQFTFAVQRAMVGPLFSATFVPSRNRLHVIVLFRLALVLSAVTVTRYEPLLYEAFWRQASVLAGMASARCPAA